MVESYRTSFFALSEGRDSDDGLVVEGVEIPLFQRDYAQGRQSDSVRRIRTDFLDVLRAAVVGGETDAVGLDFVYGGVNNGTLRPLDGQQRLTTLFLLHWYVASRSGHLNEEQSWKRFSYATRQSARMFCRSLVKHPLPDGAVPSEWIKDQPWYLFVWRHDPTIQSMLVVLDAIDERFRDIDEGTAWARLTDAENPAIWFLLLPLSGLGADSDQEALYIKMNSRGKPLTEFENFKAHFEKTIEWSPRSSSFALNVDTKWSDLFWRLRGDDGVIDDEFMRYLEFVTETCEWRDGRTDGVGQRLSPRAQAVFGSENPRREAHLDFLFQALDVWAERSESELFDSLFTVTGDAETDTTKVRLFFRKVGGSDESPDLFEGCCRSYGEAQGRARTFSLGQTLILYAVLLHLIEDTPEFPRRIRVLRNVIEASTDELRLGRMPEILDDVHRIIRDGAVEGVGTLNQAQAADETLKAEFLASNPSLRQALFALEDHALLHGSIGAFELDPTAFEARARVFERLWSQSELWPHLLPALLAVGEYQRRRTNSRPFLFGTDSERHDSAWRELLTGPPRKDLQPTRQVLAVFLDRIAASQLPTVGAMDAITSKYLERCKDEKRFDWRYYMVRYPSMREDGASTYFAESTDDAGQAAMGYSLCMLKAGRSALHSYYRDPYLLAIWRELDDQSVVEDEWFSGYETQPRRLPLTQSGSGTAIRCVPAGFELTPPAATFAELFAAACVEIGSDSDNLVNLPQVEVDGHRIDTVDRIQVGADIVRRLVAAGL